MNSLKSGFVVAVMLAAGYGTYVMLVKPPPMPGGDASIESDWWQAQREIESSLADTGQTPTLTGDVGPPDEVNTAPEVQLLQEGIPQSTLPAVETLPTAPVTPTISISAPTAGAETAQTTVIGAPGGTSDAQVAAVSAPKQATSFPSSTDAVAVDIPSTATSGTAVANSPGDALAAAGSELVASSSDLVGTGLGSATEMPSQSEAFEKDWQTAENDLAAGKQAADVLFALSQWYESPELSEQQNTRLLQRLDSLAGSVIYSTAHSVHPPYQIRTGETLESIAQHFQVPWQFLANVNGITGPLAITPGQELKVIHGPFRCEVDLDRHTLTVFLGRFYAGRFPIQFGQDPFPDPGEYEVLDKTLNGQDFVGSDGQLRLIGDPANPYGSMIMQLTDNLVIHAAIPSTTRPVPGCIMLNEEDIADLYAILSRQSRVVVKSSTPPRGTSTSASSLGYYER